MAYQLTVAAIIFDGTIDRVEYMFETVCNRMYVKDFTLP